MWCTHNKPTREYRDCFINFDIFYYHQLVETQQRSTLFGGTLKELVSVLLYGRMFDYFMIWLCVHLHNLPWQACCLSVHFDGTEGIVPRSRYNSKTTTMQCMLNRLRQQINHRHTQTCVFALIHSFVCVGTHGHSHTFFPLFYLSLFFYRGFCSMSFEHNIKNYTQLKLQITDSCIWLRMAAAIDCGIPCVFYMSSSSAFVSTFPDQLIRLMIIFVNEWMNLNSLRSATM